MAQALALEPAPLKRTEFVVGCAPGNLERMVVQLEAHGVPSRMRNGAAAHSPETESSGLCVCVRACERS